MNAKKTLTITIILLFLSVSIVPSTGRIAEQSSVISFDDKTLYVGGSGPGNFFTIQEAIDNASSGDTVFVFDNSSPYYENIVVNKSIDLIGENKNTTIIDGGKKGIVIKISVDYVNISGFKIQNSSHNFSEDRGIYAKYCNYSNFKDNFLYDNDYGIYLTYSNHNNIKNNIFKEHTLGVECSFSFNNSIENNSFSNNIEGVLICLSNRHIISGNTFSEYHRRPIFIEFSDDNIIKSNIIKIPEVEPSEGCVDIIIFGGGNNIIADNILTNMGMMNTNEGIYIDLSSNNTIVGNVIVQHKKPGIYVITGINNTIEGNILQNNTFGVVLYKARFNKIYRNNFIDNEKDATFILWSFQNKWDGNYWGRSRILPKPIIGRIGLFIPSWINFDWHPAKEPYDIGV